MKNQPNEVIHARSTLVVVPENRSTERIDAHSALGSEHCLMQRELLEILCLKEEIKMIRSEIRTKWDRSLYHFGPLLHSRKAETGSNPRRAVMRRSMMASKRKGKP